MTDSEKKLGLLQQAGWEARADADPQHDSHRVLNPVPEGNIARPATAPADSLNGAAAREAAATQNEAITAGGASDSEAAPQISSLMLMLYGIFGGIYVLYTFGWGIVAQQYSYLHTLSATAGGSIWVFLQTVLFWAAVLAPAAWFAVAARISRQRAANLIALLVLGIILLLPLPLFITTGGV
ncbi:hypothetical protein [Canibacter oris]|uniref:DNA polymerase III subunit gamma/tau n=1 Tax=Canibacter oris TaxID=1365628 RepID=A0A840DNJ5_9MICO|nr:hypothetical protein [Canibacter oris]MBB4071647.1 hypothetical protein [Canibacter oris]